MNEVLIRMKREAKAMLAHQDLPGFYRECAREMDHSRATFFDHHLIVRLQEDVMPFLYDDYGHGIEHSKKVAIEAGAIVLAEMRGGDMGKGRELMLLAHMAGLLHDICRLEDNHAARGAELCATILADYPLERHDIERIAFAVSDHEAFTERQKTDDPYAELLSGALYDADKFRWGPDNFSTTLWEMCDYNDIPVEEILALFPKGVDKIAQIASTFRTGIGKSFGPEFIELGLKLGNDVYRKLRDVAASAQADTD